MSFLAPMFLAGLAALALPVLLHLRKNRPKETVAFSSLMFLEDNPPVTKTRSRLQDVLLLILRCLALALLIGAFARPFFAANEEVVGAGDGEMMNLVLIDTSASMRGEPSELALQSAEKLIAGFPDEQWIAVGAYSDKLRLLLAPERARQLVSGERKSSALAVLPAVKADWMSTKMDEVLLAALASAGQEGRLNIHVISDLQKGATLEGLNGELWRDGLQLLFHPVLPSEGWTNAGVRMLSRKNQEARVRVTNSEGSEKSDFMLSWTAQSEPMRVSVAPGESAVFEGPVDLPAEGVVKLAGDDFDYDNEASWVTPVLPRARVWCPDYTEASDTSESAYFLSRALQSTEDYSVEIFAERPEELPSLSIASGGTELMETLQAGGTVLFSMRDAASGREVGELVGHAAEETREASLDDHALFGEIDFKSSVFAPFADVRYSDFSGIRIWNYRVLPEELVAKGRVLARFDSGDPAWLSFRVGEGILHVLTTTWRPVDSQLALSTKFPAMLHALLTNAMNEPGEGGPLLVGDRYDRPGIHRDGEVVVAVQLDPAESERTPLPESELRALGLPLDPPQDDAMTAEVAQQLSDVEQEKRQRLGWWLLVGASLFVFSETLVAIFAGKRQTPAVS